MRTKAIIKFSPSDFEGGYGDSRERCRAVENRTYQILADGGVCGEVETSISHGPRFIVPECAVVAGCPYWVRAGKIECHGAYEASTITEIEQDLIDQSEDDTCPKSREEIRAELHAEAAKIFAAIDAAKSAALAEDDESEAVLAKAEGGAK